MRPRTEKTVMNTRKKMALIGVLGVLLCTPALTACGPVSVSLLAPLVTLSIAQDR